MGTRVRLAAKDMGSLTTASSRWSFSPVCLVSYPRDLLVSVPRLYHAWWRLHCKNDGYLKSDCDCAGHGLGLDLGLTGPGSGVEALELGRGGRWHNLGQERPKDCSG